ncbi:MAG: Transcriptional regulator, MarR family, partial [uncultured Craurococcus sp.]
EGWLDTCPYPVAPRHEHRADRAALARPAGRAHRRFRPHRGALAGAPDPFPLRRRNHAEGARQPAAHRGSDPGPHPRLAGRGGAGRAPQLRPGPPRQDAAPDGACPAADPAHRGGGDAGPRRDPGRHPGGGPRRLPRGAGAGGDRPGYAPGRRL